MACNSFLEEIAVSAGFYETAGPMFQIFSTDGTDAKSQRFCWLSRIDGAVINYCTSGILVLLSSLCLGRVYKQRPLEGSCTT